VTPEEAAAIEAAQERQLRDLATQITQMTKLGFDPLTIRKGTVVAISDNTNPPTVSINISGADDTLVSQVRTLNNYTPLVGQTVLIGKQGTEIFLLGSIASVNPKTVADSSTTDNGWIKATLSNGSHGGSEGDVHYRRVLDHGSWKMQWRGSWVTNGNFTMIASGGLDPDYRPASNRYLAAAREADGAVTLRVLFAPNGSVVIAESPAGISNTNPGTSSVVTSSYVEHSHGGAVSLVGITHNDGSHSHTVNNHSHGGAVTIDHPSWVSLDGLEYFL
jgi:hypothetical protein